VSEQDAFLKEILANPADREVRLVFADWLEENGDPRGELIRLQIQLEEMKPGYVERRSPSLTLRIGHWLSTRGEMHVF
jgi:uncharacterized protein (TIGR02996 family)